MEPGSKENHPAPQVSNSPEESQENPPSTEVQECIPLSRSPLFYSASAQSKVNRNPPLSKIKEGLYLGDCVSSHRGNVLRENNITAVVSILDYRYAQWGAEWYKNIINEGNHLFIPCKDSMTHDLLPEMANICDFIHGHLNRESFGVSNVLVHCYKGVSRSATGLIAYLMRTYKWSVDEALDFVKEKRRIKPNKNFREQLEVWEAVRYEIWEDTEGKVPKAEYAAYLEIRAERLKEAGLTGDEPVLMESL